MNLDYKVMYSSKRKTLSLCVERDKTIIVRAPIGISEEKIKQIVESKKLWLYEKLNYTPKYPDKITHKEFVSGETILYLGKNYRLEITDDQLPDVRFKSIFLISSCHQTNAFKLFRDWYIKQAHIKLPPKVKEFAESLGVQFNKILVSDMKYCWATCTPNNNLNFNWRIMKAPIFVIDYLIVHELAHLLESNHTPRFWNIVAVQIPNYQVAKNWLRDNGNLLEEDFLDTQ
ncbi:MAG: M48 family metallopeptidase [Dolichospermum sp. BR01]|nr:M48 family metallopeptidase [Dolichospermum sp. BR01]